MSRCRTVRPLGTFRVIVLVFASLFGAVGVGAVIIGLIGLGSGHAGGGVAAIVVGLAFGGLGWFLWRLSDRGGPALSVRVCPDTITMTRHGQVVDTLTRSQIGLVVLHTAGRGGFKSFEVYGSDRNLVGRWDTNWGLGAGPGRSMMALRHHQYPWVYYDPTATSWQTKFRSKLAPQWTDEVLTR